jgi:hypothetical protein
MGCVSEPRPVLDEPDQTARLTRVAAIGYAGSVILAVCLLVMVGDPVLAGFLIACEVSVVTAIHLVTRAGPRRERPAYDPTLPVLDRPGHEPATKAEVWRTLGAFFGVIGFVLLIVAIVYATGN